MPIIYDKKKSIELKASCISDAEGADTDSLSTTSRHSASQARMTLHVSKFLRHVARGKNWDSVVDIYTINKPFMDIFLQL
jgi:hypothetical protein